MKKIILIFIVLIVGIIWIFKATECRLESRKVQKAARPIVKSFAEYIDKNGMPESIDDVEGIKYKLISCKGNKKVEGCHGYDDRKYFLLNKDAYSFWGDPYGERKYLLTVVHNDTFCDYKIFLGKDKKGLDGMKNYMFPMCGKMCGTTWWRM